MEVVVTSAPLRQRVGYGPAEPMIEILVGAGVLWDERLVNADVPNLSRLVGLLDRARTPQLLGTFANPRASEGGVHSAACW